MNIIKTKSTSHIHILFYYRTAYHYAAFFGYKELLEELIKGSKLLDLMDSKDATGKTPLFKVCRYADVL